MTLCRRLVEILAAAVVLSGGFCLYENTIETPFKKVLYVNDSTDYLQCVIDVQRQRGSKFITMPSGVFTVRHPLIVRGGDRILSHDAVFNVSGYPGYLFDIKVVP